MTTQKPIPADERSKSTLDEWMKNEGIPIYEGHYGQIGDVIEDVTELPRRPWARLGGKGTFIDLEPTRRMGKMVYVAEIPSGKALEPERHLYDEIIYVLGGRGLAEVWYKGEGKRTFEFGEGSLFSMPSNVFHKFTNGGREPVLFLAQTNAPVVMAAFRNLDFIFNNDYKFTDQYAGQADYFTASNKRESDPEGKISYINLWYTNFIPDLRTCFLDNANNKVFGGKVTFFRMGCGPNAHASEWPPGTWHTADYHVGGAIILGLKGEGFVLLWDRRWGIHPFEDGHGDKVVKVNWRKNGIYTPGNGVFHQHFSTSTGPARQLRWAGNIGLAGSFSWARPRAEERAEREHMKDLKRSRYIRDGGPVIGYEDEDPEITRMIKDEFAKKGIKCIMPPVVHRTDKFKLPYEIGDEGGIPGEV